MSNSYIVISSDSDGENELPSLSSDSEPESGVVCHADARSSEKLHDDGAGNPHMTGCPTGGSHRSVKRNAEGTCKKSQPTEVIDVLSSDDDEDFQRAILQVVVICTMTPRLRPQFEFQKYAHSSKCRSF